MTASFISSWPRCLCGYGYSPHDQPTPASSLRVSQHPSQQRKSVTLCAENTATHKKKWKTLYFIISKKKMDCDHTQPDHTPCKYTNTLAMPRQTFARLPVPGCRAQATSTKYRGQGPAARSRFVRIMPTFSRWQEEACPPPRR